METATLAKPRTRRGRGEGSIIFRGGRYYGILSVGTGANGQRVRRWVSGATRREVNDEMTRLRGQRLDGTLTANVKTTVEAWVRHWIANIAPHDKRPCRATTLENYEQVAR